MKTFLKIDAILQTISLSYFSKAVGHIFNLDLSCIYCSIWEIKFLIPIWKNLFKVLKERIDKLLNIINKSSTTLCPKTMFQCLYQAGDYMFKVNNRNTRTRCKICSKSTVKNPERRHWRVLVSLMLTLNMFHTLF